MSTPVDQKQEKVQKLQTNALLHVLREVFKY
jgi:hypothetical protein